MIFNEIYSAYYNAVAGIITELLSGNFDERLLNKAVKEKAFSESVLTVIPSLKSGKWQLADKNMDPVIKAKPTMPLTLVQKQWLKAITLDPRFKLFGIEIKGLEDTEPLFTPDDFYIYDKYSDGDPYNDEQYIERFRTILSALHKKVPLKMKAYDRKNRVVSMTVNPVKLEYSEKDDKFRLISTGCRYGGTINLARIVSCEECPEWDSKRVYTVSSTQSQFTLKVKDERNALERVLLHFAHLKKRAERTGDGAYTVNIEYDMNDKTEMVIRVLSFGPLVEVTGPEDFRELIKERLILQKDCGL